MPERVHLSSSLTPVLRTVLPAGWAVALVALLLAPVPEQLSPPRWFLVGGLVLLLVQSAAWFTRLRDVQADADGLVVSDGRVSARVPWAQVAAIRRPWWGKGQFARIELRTPTRLGSTVLLVLGISPLTRWADHPSVRTVIEHLPAPPSGSPRKG